jgi:chemotaxis protein histidine kinase CheA
LLIPNENLFNQSDNSQGYKNRFIEDLLMNVHIQRILFEEVHSTLYYTDRYQLAEDEILLLESDLNTYLDKEPIKKVHAVTYPLLEDVQPSRLMEFMDKVEPVEVKELESESESDSEEMNATLKMKSRSKSRSKSKSIEEPVEEAIEDSIQEPVNPSPEVESEDLESVPVPSKKPDESESESESEEVPVKKESTKKESAKKESSQIATLSRKIAENKSTKSVKKAEEFVQSAKSIHQKVKSPASEQVLMESQEHLQELQPSRLEKIKHIHPDIIPCIKTFYFKKDSKWKEYFPPKTIGFRIMKGDTYQTSIVDVKCNFIMALQILKDYDTQYSTLTIRELKEMLIRGYTHLSDSVDTLEKKFKKEKKRFKKWSDILMESYPFTQLDLLVLMYEYKLPVVLFVQTKNNIHLITYHTNDTFKYYIKMKKKDIFMFFIYQHQFKIERKDMDALYEAERDIVYLSHPEQLVRFFEKY